MASLFEAAVREGLAPAINEVMGQPFTLLPRAPAADVNAADIADPSRAEASFIGVFLDPPAKPMMAHAYDMRTDLRPGTDATMPRIDIMPNEVARGITVRKGDLIVSAAGQRWRVSHVTPTKTAILRCFVNLVG